MFTGHPHFFQVVLVDGTVVVVRTVLSVVVPGPSVVVNSYGVVVSFSFLVGMVNGGNWVGAGVIGMYTMQLGHGL